MATVAKHMCCLVGGTFDRLHSGHKLLLSVAISRSKSVEIHVVNDEMAKGKSPLVESYDDRVNRILDWLDTQSYHTAKIFQLNDSHGPAPTHKLADAIVGTPETIGNCEEINRMRQASGLGDLAILEVPHMIDYTGSIISSSRIRGGLIDQDGNPWIESELMNAKLKMCSKLDAELKKPMGSLFEGPEEYPEIAMSEAYESLEDNHGAIVAVGDVSVRTLLGMDLIPDIGIIDGMTKRMELEESQKISSDNFSKLLEATNPAGHITPSLISSIQSALESEETVLIDVDGEEDLAPIIIHCLAPIGTIVIYGQPKVGVVVQRTSILVKQRCRNIISLFEVIN